MKLPAVLAVLALLSATLAATPGEPAPARPATQPSDKAQSLPKDVAAYLQDISATIHAGDGMEAMQGSGVFKTRDGATYVWTAAHVVAPLRTVREVIDTKTGGTRKLVEFADCEVVKELVENGRSVGQIRMAAEVIRYSNADNGEDLALLRIRKKNFVNVSAEFYLGDTIPNLGTKLFHVGSLKGQFGSNSMTTGIVSQIGRVRNNVVYDQTTCTAFPGSSGGGVYLEDGRYMGMLVRGAGETFNLVVPIRRMADWAKRVDVLFAIDDNVPVPTEEELRKRPVEDAGSNVEFNAKLDKAPTPQKPSIEAKKSDPFGFLVYK